MRALESGMPFALRLTHDEPRLVYLALTYHLARPGSELDPATKMPLKRGLRAVKEQLGPQLEGESAIIELDEALFGRLLSAIFGSVNELRVYHMHGGAAATDVVDFAETLRGLFPEVAEDPEEALAVSEAMMMLHRRLERAVRQAAEQGRSEENRERGRRRWPFRR